MSDEQYPRAVWRLLIMGAASGPTNMAIDEAITEAVAARLAPPTLRFYQWEPPCLSLGRTQPVTDADGERLQELGWGLVRRPTGGRAILHADELTYSLAAPDDDPRLRGGVLASYRRLSAALLAGLARLGAEGRQAPPLERRAGKSPICFETPSDYEIVVGAKKLIGSAQARRRGVALQHGALPLTGDPARICAGLRFSAEAERAAARLQVRRRAATQAEALGRRVSYSEAVQALVAGFAEALNLALEPGTLSARERQRAHTLARTRYASPERP